MITSHSSADVWSEHPQCECPFPEICWTEICGSGELIALFEEPVRDALTSVSCKSPSEDGPPWSWRDEHPQVDYGASTCSADTKKKKTTTAAEALTPDRMDPGFLVFMPNSAQLETPETFITRKVQSFHSLSPLLSSSVCLHARSTRAADSRDRYLNSCT